MRLSTKIELGLGALLLVGCQSVDKASQIIEQVKATDVASTATAIANKEIMVRNAIQNGKPIVVSTDNALCEFEGGSVINLPQGTLLRKAYVVDNKIIAVEVVPETFCRMKASDARVK
jgi:hypothetical protein